MMKVVIRYLVLGCSYEGFRRLNLGVTETVAKPETEGRVEDRDRDMRQQFNPIQSIDVYLCPAPK
jgi:hypothetical protein